MVNKQIQKAYEENKARWWKGMSWFRGELHHIFKRNSIFRCCPRFFAAGSVGHESNYEWAKILRVMNRAAKLEAEKNYIKGYGCKEPIFDECKSCSMLVKK